MDDKYQKTKQKTYSIQEIKTIRSSNDYILAPLYHAQTNPSPRRTPQKQNGGFKMATILDSHPSSNPVATSATSKTFSQIKHEKRKKEMAEADGKFESESLQTEPAPTKDVLDLSAIFSQRLSCALPLPSKISAHYGGKRDEKFQNKYSQQNNSCSKCEYEPCLHYSAEAYHKAQVIPLPVRTTDKKFAEGYANPKHSTPYVNLCGGRVTMTTDTCIDALTCMCGVKFLLYHCLAPPPDDGDCDNYYSYSSDPDYDSCSSEDYQDESDPNRCRRQKRGGGHNRRFPSIKVPPDIYTDPCTRHGRHKFLRWSAILLASIFCPCLCLYPPLRALSRAFSRISTNSPNSNSATSTNSRHRRRRKHPDKVDDAIATKTPKTILDINNNATINTHYANEQSTTITTTQPPPKI